MSGVDVRPVVPLGDHQAVGDLEHDHAAESMLRPIAGTEVAVRAGHTSVKTVLDIYGHPYDEPTRAFAAALTP